MHPHLLLLTDSFPSANGAGISQTLFNLLEGYPGSITVVQGSNETPVADSSCLQAAVYRYPGGKWVPVANRLGQWLNPWMLQRRLAWLWAQPNWTAGLPPAGKALVLVSTTSAEKLVVAHLLQQQYGYAVLPYFMDDWLAGNTLRWKGGNVQLTAHHLLAHAPAWLMISTHLKQALMQRYRLAPRPCLVVHNPCPPPLRSSRQQEGSPVVETSAHEQIPPIVGMTVGEETPPLTSSQPQEGLLLYAGSIWPMHADALIAVAKAIHLLQGQGHTQYRLRLHTTPRHWQQYQAQLAGPGVTYGGWVPYQQIHPLLQQAWLLLCTASFLPPFAAYSHSSTQTKLTDYLAAGIPTLMVGPAGGASSEWVETWDSGYTLATPLPADIAERICTIAALPALYQRKAASSLLHASTTFSQQVVQQGLYAFVQQQFLVATANPKL